MIKKYVPNMITCLRILGTFVFVLVKPFSVEFFVLYTFCGLTDILDGYFARKFHVISEFGSKLDSIADILYYAAMIWILLPVLLRILPAYVWYMFFGVIAARILSYIIAAVRYKCFASHHTYMNKFSGLLAFLTPYFIELSVGIQYCVVLGVVVSVATLEELLMHILHKEYRADVKTILGGLQ